MSLLGVTVDQISQTLEIYLGSSFINEFNYLGRTYRVVAQADAPYRVTTRDIADLKTRIAAGVASVSIGREGMVSTVQFR